MHYSNMVPGIFLSRPNRFLAHVQIGGETQVVHVKNTGRCRELLPPGAQVWCQHSDNPARKTAYDLITVRKGDRLINMDSQAPNAAVKEWLAGGGLGDVSELKAESKWGTSRFDFSFTKDGKKCFLEVKGVTLEEDGVVRFPDAPSERAIKHMEELIESRKSGYRAMVIFVIQMEGIFEVRGNATTHPKFATTLQKAKDAGVEVLFLCCRVMPNEVFVEKVLIG